MKRWCLKIILKTRDRLWFYVRQQYPDDTPENYEYDFRKRFPSITFSLPLMLLFTLDAIGSRIFNLKKGDGNDIVEVIPRVIILGIFWWYINKYALSILSSYPIDNKNDLGKVKNVLYGMGVVVALVLLSIGYMILFNAIWLRTF